MTDWSAHSVTARSHQIVFGYSVGRKEKVQFTKSRPVWTCKPSCPGVTSSALSLFWLTCCGYFARYRTAAFAALFTIVNVKYHWNIFNSLFVHSFYWILLQCVWPETRAFPVTVTAMWFCHCLAIRWQRKLPWVTLSFSETGMSTYFFQRHCNETFASTYLLFDEQLRVLGHSPLHSSIYTLLYMKSMLCSWGTLSAIISCLHITLKPVSIGQSVLRCTTNSSLLHYWARATMWIRCFNFVHLQSQVSTVLWYRNFIDFIYI